MPVATPSTKNLKLYTEPTSHVVRPQIESFGSLPEVLQAFQRTTGWSLRYAAGPEPNAPNDLIWSAPVNPGVGESPGHFRLEPAASESSSGGKTPLDAESASSRGGKTPLDAESASSFGVKKPLDVASARAMASALAGMLGELIETRYALWKREAELAAGVPLIPHEDQREHLAAQLEAVLRAGAQAVGCQAAALYLLDEATTELKLRSSWGLPFDRLTAPARPLKGSIADLEALLGHAVVLDDTNLMCQWRVPEDYPAAVCLPVSTPTILLGTLWFFCEERRDFEPPQTEILEVVAGRLAADLEREMLMHEAVDGAELKKQLAAAERLQRNQLPSISPLLTGWELAGWTGQSKTVGGDFYDWFCLPDGLLAVAVGHAMDRGIEAALATTALKTALRAHGQYHREAAEVLKQVNRTLWAGSGGEQFATVFYGLIDTATGCIDCATAGDPGIVVVRSDGWESLSRRSARLASGPEAAGPSFHHELQPGETIAIFTGGFRDAPNSAGSPLGEEAIARLIASQPALPAEHLVARCRERLQAHCDRRDHADRTLLVIKRTKG